MAVVNPYLQVENLSFAVGDKELFHDISFGIAEGQRIGLIARNGTGKTSLLNIIAGKEQPESGSIIFRRDLRVAYLEQTPSYPADMTVMQACLWHCKEEPQRIQEYLTKLRITDHDQPISHLSGGQLKRVALANVLCQEPDLLILDEPTNHLDLQMIEWLETYLSRSQMTLLMVTHDRYFLDRVCSVILELDDETLYTYRGNYAYYLEKRQERIDVTNAEIARANNLYRRELEWMRSTPQARSHKARYREEAFTDLERRARQRVQEDAVSLQLNSTYIGSKIFEAEYVSKVFPAREGDPASQPKVILRDFYYNFSRYEKMGIVGANGTGKSTFIKMLLGLVKPDSGRFVIGETVRFGYFSQDAMPCDQQMKVIDAVRRVAEYVDLGGGRQLSAMQFLQHFLFSPLQQQNYIYKLSGGERRRLQLCTVLMQNPNFLILDEPTNDLDIATLNILEDYLATFRGCVIVVSHDRYFMDKVVDHLLVFRGDGDIKDFPGNYSQFRAWEKEQSSAANSPGAARDGSSSSSSRGGASSSSSRGGASSSSSRGGSSSSSAARRVGESQRDETKERPRRLTFKEKRELEALEADIAALEEEKKALEAALCSGTLSVDELTEKSKRLPLLTEELDTKELRWLELSEIAG
ncbi:MAG: ABC-F family ATP-binding cassette domain-containing protein [Bacteroidaceae bacterium]|nr:ABC-F family ATP-binding cassette domain-containing protein [Bacteroidaceae bacterium]